MLNIWRWKYAQKYANLNVPEHMFSSILHNPNNSLSIIIQIYMKYYLYNIFYIIFLNKKVVRFLYNLKTYVVCKISISASYIPFIQCIKTFGRSMQFYFFSSSLYMYFDNRIPPLHYIFGNISLKNSIIFRLKIVFKVIVIWVITNCV